jgi:hypothetical protein
MQITSILENEIKYTNKFNDYNIKIVRYISRATFYDWIKKCHAQW